MNTYKIGYIVNNFTYLTSEPRYSLVSADYKEDAVKILKERVAFRFKNTNKRQVKIVSVEEVE